MRGDVAGRSVQIDERVLDEAVARQFFDLADSLLDGDLGGRREFGVFTHCRSPPRA